jgi:hypothetical protein
MMLLVEALVDLPPVGALAFKRTRIAQALATGQRWIALESRACVSR